MFGKKLQFGYYRCMEAALYALKKFFGYTTFRPLQKEIIQAVVENKDCLVLMPTGGGKSLCYQIPALIKEGIGICISPLISLMKDQVDALLQNGIPAACINSTHTFEQAQAIQAACQKNKIKLLYISPEKLQNPYFLSFLQTLTINLFAIDEAHCISFWGHDFRPEYTQLCILKQTFPHIPILALTATADTLTRQDIIHQLQLRDPILFIASFDRPNLWLEVRPAEKRISQIEEFIKTHPQQAGIIYCQTRKKTEEVAQKLREKGILALPYHAGLENQEREKIQDLFLQDKVLVICATIAFGMGINKPNVRYVIHYSLPKNIECYYQEIGRAGRDGLPATALLFYSPQDVEIWLQIMEETPAEQKELSIAKLERLIQYIHTPFCRRNVLLQYFGETKSQKCNHCDNCHKQFKEIDGTEIAQKILSAITRTQYQATLPQIVDILIGKKTPEILKNNWHQIKTFGIGKELQPLAWKRYIEQLIALGYIEISYKDKQKLKLHSHCKLVLFEGKKIQLIEFTTTQAVQNPTYVPNALSDLKNQLQFLRAKLAEIYKTTPQNIFSDAALTQMLNVLPLTYTELSTIQGLAEQKLNKFGKRILEVIHAYIKQKVAEGKNSLKGSTYFETLFLYEKKWPLDKIAEERKLPLETIYNHLATLLEMGIPIDLSLLFSKQQMEAIQENLQMGQKEELLRENIKNHLNPAQLKLAIAYLKQQQGTAPSI
ncbi:MAG: DNA helicase RecQ [Bacteroidia bacterium]|nr:DNA helicase RecQ [Bacteroidia bacterium]MDW8157844.1 DNA helicase RecQ [Bacteroidia bacterium]